MIHTRDATERRSTRLRTAVALVTAVLLTGAGINAAVGKVVSDTGPESVFRMNAGGEDFVDHLGREWVADTGAVDGDTVVGKDLVDGTLDQELFRTQRVGMSAYEIPIDDGDYLLRLYFAAIGDAIGDEAVFSVAGEDKELIDEFDVVTEVGPNMAEVQQFEIEVTGDALDLEFTGDDASLAALELLIPEDEPASDAGADTERTTTSGKQTATAVASTDSDALDSESIVLAASADENLAQSSPEPAGEGAVASPVPTAPAEPEPEPEPPATTTTTKAPPPPTTTTTTKAPRATTTTTKAPRATTTTTKAPKANKALAASEATQTHATERTEPAIGISAYRMSASPTPIVDNQDDTWRADKGTGGTSGVLPEASDSLGVDLPVRVGAREYRLAVLNGTYTLDLTFVNNNGGVFDATVEDVNVLSEFDVSELTETDGVVTMTVAVTVADGVLDIEFASDDETSPAFSTVESFIIDAGLTTTDSVTESSAESSSTSDNSSKAPASKESSDESSYGELDSNSSSDKEGLGSNSAGSSAKAVQPKPVARPAAKSGY